MPYTRDPLSVRFDLPARRLVEEAYEVRGDWAGMLLAPPGPRARAWMRAYGIDPYERDRWGELRYIRAFKRSVFWQVKWYGGVYGLRGQRNSASGGAESRWGAPVRVAWRTGRMVPADDGPGAFAVAILITDPGGRAEAIGRASRERWIDDAGHPTFRQSNPAYGDRPWE